jgi:hypothetical protein
VRSHLHLLSILQLVWGGILLMLGVSMLFLLVGAIAIGWTSEGSEIPAVLTALTFGIFGAALLAGGAANAWAGRALQRYRANGRIVTLSLSVLNLFVLPFGTALGIYAFWVLLHNETRGILNAK